MFLFLIIWLCSFPFVINKTVNGTFCFDSELYHTNSTQTSESRSETISGAVSSSGTMTSLSETTVRTSESQLSDDPFAELASIGETITLYDEITKKETKVSAEYYTATIMASVSSIDFSDESLKACCIAVRTKALYDNASKGKVTSDDDAFRNESDHTDDITETEKYNQKILNAVKSTFNTIIKFGDETANTLYHLSSPGKTESYKNLYGKDIPYLSGTAGPDESSYSRFYAQKHVTAEQFREMLEITCENIEFKGEHSEWISDISFDNCLRCKYVEICESAVSGTTLMKTFGLNSTCIMISTTDDGFIFSTEGVGHGLGLSFYGAYLLGEQGSVCGEILEHYYKDITITYET